MCYIYFVVVFKNQPHPFHNHRESLHCTIPISSWACFMNHYEIVMLPGVHCMLTIYNLNIRWTNASFSKSAFRYFELTGVSLLYCRASYFTWSPTRPTHGSPSASPSTSSPRQYTSWPTTCSAWPPSTSFHSSSSPRHTSWFFVKYLEMHAPKVGN